MLSQILQFRRIYNTDSSLKPYAPSQNHKSAESSTLPQSVRYPLPLRRHSDFAASSMAVARTKLFCWTLTSLSILLANVRASGLPFATQSQIKFRRRIRDNRFFLKKTRKEKGKREKRRRMNSRIRTPPSLHSTLKMQASRSQEKITRFFSEYAAKWRISHNLNTS